MQPRPFLILCALLGFLASTYIVLFAVFPETTASILAAHDSDAAPVIWISLLLIVVAALLFFRKNKPAIDRLFSGKAQYEDMAEMWVGKPRGKTSAKSRS
jgi:hypothetical protein